ncbi:MAG: hypothetical protein M1827_000975 [Pycnora praestabilis]|nr:MAG: hypothetical protein M1827_000975 [Pycnora praestabilis]
MLRLCLTTKTSNEPPVSAHQPAHQGSQSPSRLPVSGRFKIVTSNGDNSLDLARQPGLRGSLLPQRNITGRDNSIMLSHGRTHKTHSSMEGLASCDKALGDNLEEVKQDLPPREEDRSSRRSANRRGHIAQDGSISRSNSVESGQISITSRVPQSFRPVSTAPPSMMSRFKSLKQPGNYTLTPSSSIQSHSRSRSTATTMPSEPQRSVLTKATAAANQHSRPSSSASSKSTDSKQRDTRSAAKTTNCRSQTFNAAWLGRTPSNAVKHTVAISQGKGLEHKKDPRLVQNTSGTTSVSSQELKAASRPAFSTLQRHFTPKKSLRAPSSSLIAPSPPKIISNAPMPAEFARLQIELLQLHLMHSTSAEVQAQWKQDAERKLKRRFEDTAAQYRDLTTAESRMQERLNLLALRDWNDRAAEYGLAQRMNLLGPVIQEIWTSTDHGGKLACVAKDFDRWTVTVTDIWRIRDSDTFEQAGDLKFIDSLGGTWKAEISTLSRRMTSCLRNLEELGEPLEGSSLAAMAAGFKEIAEDTLEELDVMRAIEQEVMGREREWIASKIVDIAQGVDDGSEGPESTHQGVWQVV